MKTFFPGVLLSIGFILLPITCISWGFFAHRQINRLAVFCLPPELFGFFKQHADYLADHAVDPDKRRYLVEGEGEKHFIDVDRYEFSLPLDTLPKTYREAVGRFGKDTVHANGIGPWNIQWMLEKLTEAFRTRQQDRILKYAAEIGHYVADVHVPLHTTSNYNGQLTGQHGIHAFFESRLPELFYPRYQFFLGSAVYLQNPLEAAWDAVRGGFSLLPLVLEQEKSLQIQFPENGKFSWESKGTQLIRVYSPEFSASYHTRLQHAVENRMQASVLAVASFWYTAWVNAGQPDLTHLPEQKPDSSLVEKFPVSFPLNMLGRSEN